MAARNTHTINGPGFIADPKSVNRSMGRQIAWNLIPESYRQGAIGSVTVATGGAAQGATSIPVSGVNFNIPVGAELDFGGLKFARVSSPYTSGDANLTVDALPTALVATDVAKYFDPSNSGKKRLRAGTVLSEVVTLTYVGTSAARTAGNTGNGTCTMASPSTGAGVKPGAYVVSCIEPASNGGVFEVTDPDGVLLGIATVGVAFTGVVKFTIADGATDFVAGDGFVITVAETATNAANAGQVIPRAIGAGYSAGILETDAIEGERSAGLTGYGMIVGGVLYENLLPDATGTPKALPTVYKTELRQSGTGFAFETYSDSRTS